ncbi:MAG: hypothetical protein MJ154_02810 [Candidatus Saccharibacteria bacterium]|nr:hypothetical protein [Candidatus Saccharibacteria bacterium]
MEGTSVLDQHKKSKAAPANAAQQSVLAQKPAHAGEQSVLGAAKAAGPKKPITFYKKAWFWITIAVVLLGTGGLVTFLVINNNIRAEAAENFSKYVSEAYDAVNDFNSEYKSAFNDFDIASYYSNQELADSLRDKCAIKLGLTDEEYKISNEIDKTIEDITGKELNSFINIFKKSEIAEWGNMAIEKYGVGETKKMADTYKKIVETYKDVDDKIDACEDAIGEELKGSYTVTLGDFYIEDDSSWPDYYLPVSVKNNNKDFKIKFRIELEAYDTDGTRLGTDYIYTELIEPGKTSKDNEAFDGGYLSRLEKMKTAKFKVTKVTVNSSEKK